MEPIEILCNKQDQAQIMKGKRTKRPRLPSPLRLTMASGTDDNNSAGIIHDMATTSAQDHHQLRSRESTEEEEDMANCLILLAQGHTRKPISDNKDNKVYLYQCKTCDRCFPSFQALGGHRASHKKPKPNINTQGKSPQMQAVSFGKEEGERYELATTSTTLSLQISNWGLYNSSSSSSSSSKSKVHECSICGAEFSSGQALGGHMRRHRTFVNNCTTASATANGIGSTGNSEIFQEPKNVLKLDLNLPAPDDDHRESKLSFSSKENVLVFSASSLVDCHY